MTRILRTALTDIVRYYRCWRIKRALVFISITATQIEAFDVRSEADDTHRALCRYMDGIGR